MVRRWLLIFFAGLGCSCARACAPETVAQGTSRLTVRTFGALVERVNADDRCGFAAESVLAKPEILADGGVGTGRVVYSVDDCALDFTRAPNVSENCAGVATEIRGRAIVTARRTVRGTLTGDPNNPIIPGGPDAVSIEIRDAVLEEFSVRSESIDAELIIHQGSIRGVAEPRIARSASLGICKVPTRDIRFSDLRWGPSHARLLSDGHDIDLDIEHSSLHAILGQREDGENELTGVISVWGTEHAIPVAGDTDGLLPGYERESFVEEFVCADDLQQPLTFECATFGELMAAGASKLTVLAFGTVLKKVNDQCPLEAPHLEGQLGERGGKATWSLGQAGCALEGVTVRGTKTIRGIISGDPESPVIPTEHYPAELDLTLEFSEFSVTTDDGTRTLHVTSGSLHGVGRPYLELDPATRVCSTPTENVNLRGLAWSNGIARIESEGKRFNVAIADSALDADVGLNALDGSITVNGEVHQLHGPIRSPRSEDAECNLNAMLGEAVARLTVRSLGAISKAINADTDCGFEAPLVKIWPTNSSGRPGELGSLEHTTSGCGLEFSGSKTDCLGQVQQTQGNATVTAVRNVRGLRENIGFVFKSIVPQASDSVTLNLDVDFDQFHVDEDERALTIERGKVIAEVHPMTGESLATPGTFDVPTPIAHFASVRFENVQAVVRASGKTFRVKIDRGQIEAQNGSFLGRANAIRGELVVDGEAIPIALMSLQPEYDQADFDARYACTEDLTAPVPPANVAPPSL